MRKRVTSRDSRYLYRMPVIHGRGKHRWTYVQVGDRVMYHDRYKNDAGDWQVTAIVGATVNHPRQYRRPYPYPRDPGCTPSNHDPRR